MNINGKVIQVLPVQKGQGKNGEWQKQEIIIETDGMYPKKVCISLCGDKVNTIQSGAIADIQIDAESREYNGRWYTELRAWKIEADSNIQKPGSNNSKSDSQESDDLQF